MQENMVETDYLRNRERERWEQKRNKGIVI